MAAALDRSALDASEDARTLGNELSGGVFADAAHFGRPDAPLRELEAARAKLDVHHPSARGAALDSRRGSAQALDAAHSSRQRHAKLFGVLLDDGSSLVNARETFDKTRTLWTMVERWDEDYRSWTNEAFLSRVPASSHLLYSMISSGI